MVPTRSQVQEVCEGIRPTFPLANSDPPVVHDDYFEGDTAT